jgi:magnesium chelatase family protein
MQAACDIQEVRFTNPESKSTEIVCNADIRIGEIKKFCKLQDEGQYLMRAAMSLFNLLARAYHRILKLARTIANLAWNEEIQFVHLAEALLSPKDQYRVKYINKLKAFLRDVAVDRKELKPKGE